MSNLAEWHCGHCGLSWATHDSTSWWPGWRKCATDGSWQRLSNADPVPTASQDLP